MMNTDQLGVVLAAEFLTGAVYLRSGSPVVSFAQESVIRSFR
jgi:hypothetical protein